MPAVSDAVSNSVEHSYPDRHDGDVTVQGHVVGRSDGFRIAELAVTDTGRYGGAVLYLGIADLRPAGKVGLDSVGGYGVDDGVMRTSELAGRAGVNSETLRYYERRGLLDEPPRTSGGYRDYPDAAVELLRFVKRAQELGFTLDEVEELLHLDGGGPEGCDAARALAETRKADLEARIADLQRMRDSLAELVATCDLPRDERTCPLLAGIATRPAQDRSRRHR